MDVTTNWLLQIYGYVQPKPHDYRLAEEPRQDKLNNFAFTITPNHKTEFGTSRNEANFFFFLPLMVDLHGTVSLTDFFFFHFTFGAETLLDVWQESF